MPTSTTQWGAPAPAPAPLSDYARVAALFAAVASDASLRWTQQSVAAALQRAGEGPVSPSVLGRLPAAAPSPDDDDDDAAAAAAASPSSPLPLCLPSTPPPPFSPLVPRVLVTGRSTRRQRRVAVPERTPADSTPDGAASHTPQPSAHDRESPAAGSTVASDVENASAAASSCPSTERATAASHALPSLPRTPLAARDSPLRDATNRHTGDASRIAQRLSFNAAVCQSPPPPPPPSKPASEQHSNLLEHSFSCLSFAPALVASACDSLGENDLLPSSNFESNAPAALGVDQGVEDDDGDEDVCLQPRRTRAKKKRIVVRDSEEESGQDDEVEAVQHAHQDEASNEDSRNAPLLPAPQASPGPARLPRSRDSEESVLPTVPSTVSSPVCAPNLPSACDLDSSEEEQEFARNKPKPNKKKRIVISDDEQECDSTTEDEGQIACESPQHSGHFNPDLEGVEGVPGAGLTGEYESDESDGESSSEPTDSASSGSDSTHSDQRATDAGKKTVPIMRQKAPTHPASAASPARDSLVWNFDSSDDDGGLPASAPTPVRRPLLTPKPPPGVSSLRNRSTVKRVPKSAHRVIDSDEERHYESEDLDFIASDDDEEESDSETSSSGSDSATNSDDDSAYSDVDFDTARSTKKSRKADAALPCLSGRAFARQRVALLASTYADFNRRIFSDRLPPALCLKWSKTLLTTAGHCRWHRVHGVKEIELSIKVCDNSTKMRETLAHEMCHAAVVAIDGLHNAPAHGANFKAWGRKVTRTIPALGTVARCHSYVVHKPFKYQCENDWCKQRSDEQRRSREGKCGAGAGMGADLVRGVVWCVVCGFVRGGVCVCVVVMVVTPPAST